MSSLFLRYDFAFLAPTVLDYAAIQWLAALDYGYTIHCTTLSIYYILYSIYDILHSI